MKFIHRMQHFIITICVWFIKFELYRTWTPQLKLPSSYCFWFQFHRSEQAIILSLLTPPPSKLSFLSQLLAILTLHLLWIHQFSLKLLSRFLPGKEDSTLTLSSPKTLKDSTISIVLENIGTHSKNLSTLKLTIQLLLLDWLKLQSTARLATLFSLTSVYL